MQVPDRVEIDAAGDAVLDAAQAAALLGARLPDFLADLAAGHVFSIVERGEGADAGMLRLTLRRRGLPPRRGCLTATSCDHPGLSLSSRHGFLRRCEIRVRRMQHSLTASVIPPPQQVARTINAQHL